MPRFFTRRERRAITLKGTAPAASGDWHFEGLLGLWGQIRNLIGRFTPQKR
jgi:hypothetical protein